MQCIVSLMKTKFWCVVDANGRVVEVDTAAGLVLAVGWDRTSATRWAKQNKSKGWKARPE